MKNDEQERPEDVEVTLTPVLGVEPRVYVPIIYGILLLIVLFFVFVYPGIQRHGSMVTVITNAPNASLIVDGVRLATTPDTVFVPSGRRELEIRRPGFETQRHTVDVGGRLIGSWMFPRRTSIAIDLEGAAADELVRRALIEFSDWSLAGEASGQYLFPPIARELAADLAAIRQSADGEAHGRPWDDFVAGALPQVASQALLNDIVAGSLATGGESMVAVPAGIGRTVQQVARIASEAELLPMQIAAVVGTAGGRLVRNSPWFAEAIAHEDDLDDRLLAGDGEPVGSPNPVAHGLSFTELRGGEVVLGGGRRSRRGGDIAYAVTVAPFHMSTTAVPFSAYAEFLDANPEWHPERMDALVADGLVDRDYLADIERMREDPGLPVTGVSAFAAEAFAAWLTTVLPDGLEARLPTEAEWEYAFRVSGLSVADGIFHQARTDGPVPASDAGTGRGGLTGLLGNVWEWTSDPFAPYTFVHGGRPPATSAHRAVRGGGWGTDAIGFSPTDRGSLDPSWCSPFVGIRLVLVPSTAM